MTPRNSAVEARRHFMDLQELFEKCEEQDDWFECLNIVEDVTKGEMLKTSSCAGGAFGWEAAWSITYRLACCCD